jgi:hypothetical protein
MTRCYSSSTDLGAQYGMMASKIVFWGASLLDSVTNYFPLWQPSYGCQRGFAFTDYQLLDD